MTRTYDITLDIHEGMIAYPGNPPVGVRPHEQIADGAAANVTALAFGSHTGTHVDAARHFIDGGQPVEQLPLDILIGPATVLAVPEDVTAIDSDVLARAGLDGATRVLLRTRNSRLLREPAFREDFAYLTGDGAAFLVAGGVRLVGMDYLSIEAFDADEPRAHETLLHDEVIVVEGLDLNDMPAGRYELICLPLRVRGIDGAPARVVLREM